MSPSILLSGYYGLGNAGDEAVLAASVQMFRSEGAPARITVLSGDPGGTAAALGVEAVPRMAPAAVMGAIRKCDLFLSGGGSLLQDRTSLKSLLYYLGLLRIAGLMGRRTMVFAQGIGPLVRPAARRWTARVLSRVDAITVRDAASAELLREIGTDFRRPGEPEVTADPVFALAPEATERVRSLTAGPPPVAVSLRPWPGVEAILDPLAEALREADAGPYRFWPLHPVTDRALCERAAAALPGSAVVDAALGPGEWRALAGATRAVVGMRLHALIFGAAAGVPVFGISYDPKVDALLDRVRGLRVGSAEAIDPAVLRQALGRLGENGDAVARRQERAEHLAGRARRNVERARELLGGEGAAG